jgi:hypothetical protein
MIFLQRWTCCDLLSSLLELVFLILILKLGMDSSDNFPVDHICFEVIPHCIGLVLPKTRYEKLRPGDDGVCVPRDYDGPVHSSESLRSLTIAYLYLLKWCRWDIFCISHGSHVARVFGLNPTRVDGLPDCMEVGEMSEDILLHHPTLRGNRVLSLIHPSLFDRGLPTVMSNLINRSQLISRLTRRLSLNQRTCREGREFR